MIIVAVLWHFFYLLIRFCFSAFILSLSVTAIFPNRAEAREYIQLARRNSRRAIVISPLFFIQLDKIRWLLVYIDYASRRPLSQLSLFKGAIRHEKGRRCRVSMEGSGRWMYFARRNDILDKNNCSICRQNAKIITVISTSRAVDLVTRLFQQNQNSKMSETWTQSRFNNRCVACRSR